MPGCDEAGEFRAPTERGSSFDGPGEWRWLCLEHVRVFNSGYNWFSGMTPDEIEAANTPYGGWDRETRAFASGGGGRAPRDASGARFARTMPQRRADGRELSDADRKNLRVLSLPVDSDRRALRERYTELVRKFHPDRNGGDRSHERALQEVIAAYQALKGRPAFA